MTRTLKILALSGSLREKSFNKSTLEAVRKLAPAEMEVEIYEGLRAIPLFDSDLPTPPEVTRLRQKIAAADAVVISTPEYNHSVPGVLKNALDWVSFPPPENPFKGKPVAILGASMSPVGTARAQGHLRQTLVFLDTRTVNKPEVLLAAAASKFDDMGELTDAFSASLIQELLGNLHALIS